uniref:hypothetical protein n=1 Tax=Bradyrhizobium sp. (strain ORS 278) TaxID=114615 RepID=UPI0005A043CB|nr:hypothetical protein [Bradyrhizobium sp. ORS 278]
MSKLGQGEFVVRARLVRSYKDEERQPTIMGTEFGVIYEVKLSAVMNGTTDGSLKPGKSLLIRQPPSPCERYVPRNFSYDTDRTLVISQRPDGIFDLVGGED